MMMTLALALLLCVSWGAAEVGAVTFDARMNPIYDTKPKLRLKGSGFQSLAGAEIDLLMLEFEPPLSKGTVYSHVFVKSDDTITLELNPGQRWMASDGPPTGRPLVLKEATYKSEKLLDTPITVATVWPTPTVFPSTNLVYLTAVPWIKMNGTNFNIKETHLFFSPPLEDGVDIEITVQSPTAMFVTLVQKATGAKWADEPGPLKLVAIDTGAGLLPLREDLGGVTIAELQADMAGHGISVQTHEEVKLYQSTKVLTVAGKGFRTDENGGSKFRFGHVFDVESNFTVVALESSAVFTLAEGSKWRRDGVAFPSPLVLLAANAGDGWVPLGATTAKSGRKIATVFEDPSVRESLQKISRTKTHELIIGGTGFTNSFIPLIVFEPPMDRENYVVDVLNRTNIRVSLASEWMGWLPEEVVGALSVVSINTGAGMNTFNEPITVAVVMEDEAVHDSGVDVLPNYGKHLYQTSSDGERLEVYGNGFSMAEEAELTFGFGGPKEGSVTVRTLSETTLELELAEGYTWAERGGPLFVTMIKIGSTEVSFPSPGIKIATINEDPLVQASELHVYASHTKHITIQGHGFMSSFDPSYKPQVVLHPTVWGEYTVQPGGWTNVALTISLLPSSVEGVSNKWADVKIEGETIPLKVVSIDTGSGTVFMPGGGIVVAAVRMDDATFSCDDSCLYSNDQQCDEDQSGESSAGLGWSSYMSPNNAVYSTSPSRASNSRSYVGSTGVSLLGSSDDFDLVHTPSCPLGTDCTDCGLEMTAPNKCSNTCRFARDGECDDRRATGVCADGTDCQDCGPWGSSNFTEADSVIQASVDAYDDDDSEFTVKGLDHPILQGQAKNAMGRYKRAFAEHSVSRLQESESAENVFMDTLWAAIVIVGFSVVLYGAFLMTRFFKGQSVNLPIPTNPDVEPRRQG